MAQQSGTQAGSEQPGATGERSPQAGATGAGPVRAPVQAAFGTSSGAAVVFRDLASI